MNPTLDTILTRRSVRRYKPDAVDGAVLEQIIQAGLYAPSGKGMQSSIVVAVTDPALRNRLSEMNRIVGGWEPGFDPFFGAPVVLIVLADRASSNHVYDGALTMGNLMLAAHSLGLGSCWINRAREVFDTEEGKEILRSLGIEGDYEGIGHCILGYSDGPEPQPKPLKAGRVYYAK